MGLLHKAKKNISGHRVYDQKDVELINWVTCLKKSGMPIERIKEYAEAFRCDENTKLEELLGLHLVKLQAQQVDLEHYIDVTEFKLNKLKNA